MPGQVNAASVVLRARAPGAVSHQSRSGRPGRCARRARERGQHRQLSARDRVEFVVGLGELLYLDECLDGCYTAAAELFELALARDGVLEPPARDLMFEWWAARSIDRRSTALPSERKPLYARILITRRSGTGATTISQRRVVLACGGRARRRTISSVRGARRRPAGCARDTSATPAPRCESISIDS